MRSQTYRLANATITVKFACPLVPDSLHWALTRVAIRESVQNAVQYVPVPNPRPRQIRGEDGAMTSRPKPVRPVLQPNAHGIEERPAEDTRDDPRPRRQLRQYPLGRQRARREIDRGRRGREHQEDTEEERDPRGHGLELELHSWRRRSSRWQGGRPRSL